MINNIDELATDFEIKKIEKLLKANNQEVTIKNVLNAYHTLYIDEPDYKKVDEK